MDTPQDTPEEPKRIQSLDEKILRYDLAKMLAEAQSEFDSSLSSRELIDQDSIAKMFNLGNSEDDERN